MCGEPDALLASVMRCPCSNRRTTIIQGRSILPPIQRMRQTNRFGALFGLLCTHCCAASIWMNFLTIFQTFSTSISLWYPSTSYMWPHNDTKFVNIVTITLRETNFDKRRRLLLPPNFCVRESIANRPYACTALEMKPSAAYVNVFRCFGHLSASLKCCGAS